MAASISVLTLAVPPATRDALAAQGLRCTEGPDALTAAEHDAVLIAADDEATWAGLAQRADLAPAAYDSAVVVLTPFADEAIESGLIGLGVQAVLSRHEAPAALARHLRHAIARKAAERAARTAYATDLATGLPHQAQLLEHMAHLLALREREPAPMVLVVLRVEGFAQAAARLGGEAANVLRRKVAVRLRAGLRASDVVAAIGNEAFGVLLGRLEAVTDGEQVAAKLVRALAQPITVAGQPCRVAAAVGLALYPEHGRDAATLLQRALGQAGSMATAGGRMGLAGGGHGAAANDPNE
jgi:diguanylate cyclase (GGDEF)-like protein